ncbi:hypothetical protein LTR50_000199 [Elasticomyces elasticus]|nr:hypothetical protein LTR50_000199 [Elasticomyces elasticus]
MGPIIAQPSHLGNSLATVEQLATSASQLDGVPADLEDSIRFQTQKMMQTAGVLLRLPQALIAQAIIILTRYWTGSEGYSLLEGDAKDAATAALYLVAKVSADSVAPRPLLTVFAFLETHRHHLPALDEAPNVDQEAYHLSEADYHNARNRMFKAEAQLLKALGFDTHVALPYTLCINYLQALGVRSQPNGDLVARRAFAHLNTALLSPQLLYLTHQPTSLATAAIYLAARESEVKLPSDEWWEVFDTDREELGFLVVAFLSMREFALAEKETWARRKVPITVDELEGELERRKLMEDGH